MASLRQIGESGIRQARLSYIPIGGRTSLQERVGGSKALVGHKSSKEEKSWSDTQWRGKLSSWLSTLARTTLLVIPSTLFWMQLATNWFNPVAEDEVNTEEESETTRRMLQFFAIDETLRQSEVDEIWNQKIDAINDLTTRLLKTPSIAKVLGGTGIDVNYIVHGLDGYEDEVQWYQNNDDEWNPRLLFSSSTGVIVCYVKFVLHKVKWVPVELTCIDANVSNIGKRIPLWKLEGQLPHGILYQRLPCPRPIED